MPGVMVTKKKKKRSLNQFDPYSNPTNLYVQVWSPILPEPNVPW